MTPQSHIDAIGAAQAKLEAALDDLTALSNQTAKAVARVERQMRRLHYLQDRAQRAFKEAHPEDNVVLFSGGIDKPPAADPDAPVKP